MQFSCKRWEWSTKFHFPRTLLCIFIAFPGPANASCDITWQDVQPFAERILPWAPLDWAEDPMKHSLLNASFSIFHVCVFLSNILQPSNLSAAQIPYQRGSAFPNFPAEKLLSWSFPSSLVVWTDPKVSHNHACENLDFSDIGGFGFQTAKSWVWKWYTPPPHKKKKTVDDHHFPIKKHGFLLHLGIPATSARSTSGDPPAAKTWKKPCRNEEKTNQHVDFAHQNGVKSTKMGDVTLQSGGFKPKTRGLGLVQQIWYTPKLPLWMKKICFLTCWIWRGYPIFGQNCHAEHVRTPPLLIKEFQDPLHGLSW